MRRTYINSEKFSRVDSRTMVRASWWRIGAAVAAIMMLSSCGRSDALDRSASFPESANVPGAPRSSMPKAVCGPGDRPEPGLQGLGDGRDPEGYRCNLERVGQLRSSAWSTLDVYKDCAYYGLLGFVGVGTQVADISNSAAPAGTTTLVTPAMLDPWESLRTNNARGLVAADNPSNSRLDLYDIASDCRAPKLLSSTSLAPATGHEGWFSPDGNTYYMSGTPSTPIFAPTLSAIDISDPRKPRLLGSWTFGTGTTHGGSTSEDGTRSYVCRQAAPPDDALMILDTSDIASRKPDPEVRVISELPLGDNMWCQGAYRVTYGGRPFLIQYGERSGAADCSRASEHWANFGYPRIYDISDERKPVLVSSMLLEVHLPQHCDEVTGQGAVNSLGYSVHHCTPDRLYDPTILACGWFKAGLRVIDIRDPRRPREIAYFNPSAGNVLAGATSTNNGILFGTSSRPVVRSERGEIVFTNDASGLWIVRFTNGVWPFKDSAPCPEAPDYLYAQYNPDSPCATARPAL